MSFTAIYSPLHPLDVAAEDMSARPTTVGTGVKILDKEGFEEFLPDWDTEVDTDDYVDKNSYPGQEWTLLHGFKTWDSERYNLERLGFYYDRDRAVEFWSELSEYTEPFQFFTSPFDGGWLHALDIATLPGDEIAAMHVVCHSGDIWMHEIPVTNKQREVVK